MAECGLERPEGRRRLNTAGQKAVEVTAERLAVLVEQALGKEAQTPPVLTKKTCPRPGLALSKAACNPVICSAISFDRGRNWVKRRARSATSTQELGGGLRRIVA